MSKRKSKNPLRQAQREKAGANTFRQYSYQYNWALLKALQLYGENREFVIFIELHEDVVVGNSLVSSRVQFEFNQVKAIKTPITSSKMTAQKNNESILGKLVASVSGKKYEKQVRTIALVSGSGFKLKLKEAGLDFDVLDISCLSEAERSKLVEALRVEAPQFKELGKLKFVDADLPMIGFRENVIGRISSLVDNRFPDSSFNSVSIYRSLIDELNRKGMKSMDYEYWDDLVEAKGLTAQDVGDVVQIHVSIKSSDQIDFFLLSVANEMEWGAMRQASIRNEITRYRQIKLGHPSSANFEIAEVVRGLVKDAKNDKNEEIAKLLKYVEENLPESVASRLGSSGMIYAAAIWEYLHLE